MKIAIVGAGAIGGLIGARLAAAGRCSVVALARGATLQALRTQGWRVQSAAGLLQVPAVAHERAEDLLQHPAAANTTPPQNQPDALIIAVKATALEALAPTLAPLIGPHTLIVPAMNGVPWWFCARMPELADPPLQTLDARGVMAQSLPLSQVVGCVVHASAACTEPGLVDHRMGQGLILGEPFRDASSGHLPSRVQALCEVLTHAGFDVTHSADIRRDIWYKLWGNLTMNPVSALTGATMDRVLGDRLLRDFCSQAMAEAARIGQRIGCPVDQTPEDRHAITARLGAVKTSMLQDVQAGRPIELDAIVAAVHEIGLRLGEPMPAIGALLGLTRVMAQQRGLYPAA